VKAAVRYDKTHNPFDETCRVSRLRENLTSGSDGEGLETGRRNAPTGHAGGNPGHRQGQSYYALPRQSFTRQTLFQCLKGRGFNLEDTRLTRYCSIKKMMAVLALTFCWAHKTGEWKYTVIKPLKNKAHGRPAKSLFRYGLVLRQDCIVEYRAHSWRVIAALLSFARTCAVSVNITLTEY